MSDIPQAREALRDARHKLAGILDCIDAALLLLDREKSVRKVRGTRAKMTVALGVRIRAWKATHDWSQQRIAEKFNVTNARVSEALRRKKWF